MRSEFFIILFAAYIVVHFFATQRIYNSKHFVSIVVSILFLSIFLYLLVTYLNESKVSFISFFFIYYCAFLFLIKSTYRRFNNYFIKQKWIDESNLNKDFTFVTIDSDGIGDDNWDKKLSRKPSKLDYIISSVLFFGPMVLLLVTLEIDGS